MGQCTRGRNASNSRCQPAMDEARLDVELFIEEVKKYPEIWDTSRKDYQDRIKKRAAWFQVCEKFCEGFAAKPDHEKNDIGKYHC